MDGVAKEGLKIKFSNCESKSVDRAEKFSPEMNLRNCLQVNWAHLILCILKNDRLGQVANSISVLKYSQTAIEEALVWAQN